ncbi:hypothetical protein H4R27_002181 [Coemansia aciculifera]|nr:hypothetical protein H4R27_002181 [Coemansia aciculifera]
MQSFAVAIAAIAAVAFADKPAAYGTPYAAAPVAQQYAAPAQVAYAAPVTVVQNAAVAEPTVTVTVTNGASSNIFSLGAAALAGSLALASFIPANVTRAPEQRDDAHNQPDSPRGVLPTDNPELPENISELPVNISEMPAVSTLPSPVTEENAMKPRACLHNTATLRLAGSSYLEWCKGEGACEGGSTEREDVAARTVNVGDRNGGFHNRGILHDCYGSGIGGSWCGSIRWSDWLVGDGDSDDGSDGEGEGLHGQRSDGQQQAPGLNFVYPACPNCGRKVAKVATAAWACSNCGSQIGNDRVKWTYRVGLGFIDPSIIRNSSRNEMSACILGITANAWFGCTAAQWVEETKRASERFKGHQQETQWIERMAEQLLCLVGMGVCGGAVGQYQAVALRRDIAPQARPRSGGKKQYIVTRLCAKKDDQPSITIVEMWRQIVRQAQSAAGISDGGTEVDSWDIATLLAAGPFMKSMPEQEALPEVASFSHAIETNWDAVLATWDTEPALQPMSHHPSTPAGSRVATQTELDDMDAFLDQCPELFHSLPQLSALSPAVFTDSQLFSWSHWEESYKDDNRYNQIADSVADNDDEWVATPAITNYPRRNVYDATPPDTLMRRLEATPESVAREIRAAKDTTRIVSSSSRVLELGNVPRILAPATPASRPALRSPSAMASTRAFVPETPILQRTYSLDTIVDCVPETPLHASTLRRRPPPPLSIAAQLPPPARLPEKKKRKYSRKRQPASSAGAGSRVMPLSLTKSNSNCD